MQEAGKRDDTHGPRTTVSPEFYVPKRHPVWPHVLLGFAVIVFLCGGAGYWAGATVLAGAVIAPGVVVVDTNVKKVQHPEGGVVGQILVKDGDRVSAGDLLIRLDDTIPRVNLQVIVKQLHDQIARKQRLLAERDGASGIDLKEEAAALLGDPEFVARLDSERSLFESRRLEIEGQKSRLTERIEQLRKQISGLTAQAEAKVMEIELIAKEISGLEKLEAKQLVTIEKMTAKRREATRLSGDRGQLEASIAEARGKISETELQLIGLDQERRTEVLSDLRETEAKEAELIEKRVAAEDQLKRVEIRAPQAGIVHQLTAHTVGGVVDASQPIMLIVPQDDTLVVEAHVAPENIESLHVGQSAFLRFTSFNSSTTPELVGRVTRVSGDIIRENASTPAYFAVRVSLSPEEIKRLGEAKLVPGMPADVHIRTADRTVVSFLIKPLQDQLARAFRER
ncbi:MAG: HlyD family type I secretion periplasmic adaptor subunit [Hyphomicrobiales bacterium]|nr:HlyD family type I secretion periplasmic adaptor subunit [Hyphomicrobiales bacterium]